MTIGELARRHAEHHAPRWSCFIDLFDTLGVDPDLDAEMLRDWIAFGVRTGFHGRQAVVSVPEGFTRA